MAVGSKILKRGTFVFVHCGAQIKDIREHYLRLQPVLVGCTTARDRVGGSSYKEEEER